MKIENNALILNEWDLKIILMHISLVAEGCSADGGRVEKLDFIELFKDSLESNKWLSDLEDAKYERLEIEI